MARHRNVKATAVFVLAAALGQLASPFAWAAEPPEAGGTALAYGAGSAVLTLIHAPLRAALCVPAALTGGLAYVVASGSPQVAKGAVDTVTGVCRGPYIITPQRLRAGGAEEAPETHHGTE